MDAGEVEPLASLSFSHVDDQRARRLPGQSLARRRKTTPVSDPGLLSVAEAGVLIQTGRLSPVELTRACLDRIDSLNPRVHAVITVIREEALDRARATEAEIRAGHYRGSFHGIPYGVKDVIASAGHPTTCGSQILRDHVTNFDATPVARLQEAGAILVAKLSLSRRGLTPLSWSQDCVGPRTRTVEDNALMLALIAGHDAADGSSSRRPVPDYVSGLNAGVKGIRIGLPRRHFFEYSTSEAAQAVRDAVRLLENKGAIIQEVDLPHMKYATGGAMAIVMVERLPKPGSGRPNHIPGRWVHRHARRIPV
jgi:Asp-tRNA(Asn)/Glu-tRNA(Gln) amidotransferase A subunit family amidase